MNGDPFKTPLNRAQSIRPTTAAKRDSLAAELERGTVLRNIEYTSNLKTVYRSTIINS